MKTITDKAQFPKDKIITFMNTLEDEKKHFLYSIDDVLDSEVLIYEEQNGRIIGMSGFRFLPGFFGKLLKLPVAYVVILKEFQGQSIGSKLFAERYRVAEQSYNYLLNTTAKDNQKMLNLMKKMDYKIVGETDGRCYFINTFNNKGVAMYHLLKCGLFLLVLFRNASSKLTP